MPKHNKGKPSGKFAESKRDPGRKGDYKRSGWPEDARTQHTTESGQQNPEENDDSGQRNRKAGSPI